MNREEAARLRDEALIRKSVRKYSADPLSGEAASRAVGYAIGAEGPVAEARAAFAALPKDRVKGFGATAPHYIAMYAPDDPSAEISAAFRLEIASLKLSAEGVGSLWMGIARPDKGARESEGMRHVISLAFGAPSEEPHRRGAGEFKRKPLAEITDIKGMDALLEPFRLAPSAMNGQPWRLAKNGDRLDLYVKRPSLAGRVFGEWLWVDAGIALSHLYISLIAEGIAASAFRAEGAPPYGDYRYAMSIAAAI